MSDFVKPEYAYPGKILLLKTRERKMDGTYPDMKNVYPAWSRKNSSEFAETKERHLYGKKNGSDKRNSKKCLQEIINKLVQHNDKPYAMELFGLLAPVGYAANPPKDGRTFTAYGMISALSCGYQVDYSYLLRQIDNINAARATASSEKLTLMKDSLCLQLRQTNYVASMLCVPDIAIDCELLALKDMRSLMGLNDAQVKHAEKKVNGFVNGNILNMRTYVNNFIQRVKDGFFLPKDSYAVQKACIDKPKEIINSKISKVLNSGGFKTESDKLKIAEDIESDINDAIMRTVVIPALHASIKGTNFYDEKTAAQSDDVTVKFYLEAWKAEPAPEEFAATNEDIVKNPLLSGEPVDNGE